MTKLESIEHKIFASEAPLDEIGQFGSALDTTKLNTKDVTTIQALPAYTKGWGSAIISDSNYPTMEEMNGVLNVMSYHTGYLYQEGMPAWRSDREYSATSIVKEPTGTKFFRSLKDGNIGNAIYDTEWWEELKLGGSGLEVCDIGMALYVDETKGLRRYLNGQIVDINANTQAFLTRLLKIKDTNPDYFTTEANWQAEKAMNLDGCVYKFVLNYDSTGTNVISVRLPKYPDYIEINNNSINNTAPVSVNGNGRCPVFFGKDGKAGQFGYSHGNEPCIIANTGAISLPPTNIGGVIFENWETTLAFSTDPSLSGLAGTATITSNFRQTKLKLRYFIQVATGQETENNIVNDIELNNPYSLFDSKYSDHELNNLSWLKSEGQWNAKAVYVDAYDKLLKVYNGTETVEGLSVKLSTEEYTDYDFVLNTAEETFRLPLLNGSEDLPSDRYTFNIISNSITTTQQTYTAPANGWVYIKGHQTTGGSICAHIRTPFGVETSLSGAGEAVNSSFKRFVKRGDTLVVWSDGASFNNIVSYFQYAKGNGSLYYYVGETVQNAKLVDVGRIGEVLPTKTDKVQAAKASMPSSKYIDLTLGASETVYTAPANGWFYFETTNKGGQYFALRGSNMICQEYKSSLDFRATCLLPVSKGKTVKVAYSGAPTVFYIRFFYAEGEV